ncbi:MAG TPA: DoxX family protein [Xanthobacteraceae bacterium]|jgi:uncharacterized membrane protein YphA (DoxX/SURF4 family)
MPTLFALARVLLVLIFAISGATRLLDLDGAAQIIAKEVPIPEMLAGLAAQIEGAIGIATPKLLAILSVVIELGGALLIALNVGTRFASALLILFTASATLYFHDFWNMEGAARMQNMVAAEKNLSIIGGLLMLFALGSWRPFAVRTIEYIPPHRRDDRTDRAYPHPAE